MNEVQYIYIYIYIYIFTTFQLNPTCLLWGEAGVGLFVMYLCYCVGTWKEMLKTLFSPYVLPGWFAPILDDISVLSQKDFNCGQRSWNHNMPINSVNWQLVLKRPGLGLISVILDLVHLVRDSPFHSFFFPKSDGRSAQILSQIYPRRSASELKTWFPFSLSMFIKKKKKKKVGDI